MQKASLIAILFLVAACRHAPPDRDARAVAPTPEQRHTPDGVELGGLWQSRVLRGAFADLGTFAVYVFGPDGRYTGAIAGDRESTPLEGSWTYEAGVLTLDGSIEMRAIMVGDRLQLVGSDSFIELMRPVRSNPAPPPP